MRKLVAALAFAAVLSLGVAIQASAATSFGPFPGGSADSGTCNNDWANDTYQRNFSATLTGETLMVTETFTNGRFTTIAGKSPGGNNLLLDSGGNCATYAVAAGIKGSFTGSETGPVTGGSIPTGTVTPDCPPPNTTGCFIKAIFGANAVFTATTFKFNYAADCGQSLVERTWQNADATSGGNVGDIRSAPGETSVVPCPTPTPTPTASPTPHPVVLPATGGGPSASSWWIVALGLGVIAVGQGVAILVIRRRRS